MRRVSLHLRITKNLYDVLLKTLQLNRSFMQCFLLSYPKQQHLIITPEEQRSIIKLIDLHNLRLYIHAPYWINLCSDDISSTQRMLYAEIKKISAIRAYAYVMHLGHASAAHTTQFLFQRIEYHLQYLIYHFPHMHFILENSSYNPANQGVYLQDFDYLFSSFSNCITLSFCLDTAHAYSAGYNIAQSLEYDRLITDLKYYVGYKKISLIHCNDTLQPIGSTQDIHHWPGQGLLGREALQKLMNDPIFENVPVILELPNVDLEQQETMLHEIEQWIKKE